MHKPPANSRDFFLTSDPNPTGFFLDEEDHDYDHVSESIGPAVEPTTLSLDQTEPSQRRSVRPAEMIPLEQLLESLDIPREERPRRDLRPGWLREIIDCVSGLFEPLAHAGRVGYDCKPVDGRWQVCFYLAVAEHVGGALDGHVEAVNFQFDIRTLIKCFERLDRCDWRVFPSATQQGDDAGDRPGIPAGLSVLLAEGVAMTESGLAEPLRIEVHSLPPAETGVGLKLYTDGQVAVAEPT